VDDSQSKRSPISSENSYQSPPVKVPPAFSLAKIVASKQGWPKYPKTDSNSSLVQEETDEDSKREVEATKELLDLILELDRNRDKAPVTLEVVCPNWLMSGSSRPGGTGGPGGPPSAYTTNPAPTQNEYEFKLDGLPPEILRLMKNQGAGVAVAILDTSYDQAQLDTFYNSPIGMAHPILQSLRGMLQVHTNPAVETNLPNLGIDGHDYEMIDHGLFVAGIINRLAPQAELHLYQVLNKNGLGDLFIIAQTLQRVLLGSFGGKSLVVNLSLTMNLPLDDGCLKPNDQFKVGEALLNHRPWWLATLVATMFNGIFGKQHLCTCDTWLERQAKGLEWISDLVYARNSRLIAAAGNESKGKSSRLPAMYPAAFDRVLGVGALARGTATTPGLPATYSNLADTPVIKGISTLGGEEGEAHGILGVYMGEFPRANNGSPQKNQNGWAWWSGTSFATPIVTGITASVLSCLAPGSTAEDAIALLFRELQPAIPVASAGQPINEDILFIKQG
jgi:hypothetical protein